MSAPKPTVPKASVADDEDLDDLDDVLDEFSKPAPASKPKAPQPAASSSALPTPPPVDEELDDAFVRDLAAGMENLMRDLAGDDKEAQQAIESSRAEWEQALKGLQEAAATAGPSAAASGSTPSAAADANFQASLRATLDKLKNSEDTLKADEADGASADSFAQLQDLLASLAGEPGEGGEGDDDGQLSGVLQGLMQSLMSKEILYEPMKDLGEKYPEYIEQHKATLKPDELKRYQDQSALVGRIVAIFQTPGYSDEDPVRSAEVLTLMNEMQALGSPPQEIMGDMPPGFEAGPDGLPKMPDNCTIS